MCYGICHSLILGKNSEVQKLFWVLHFWIQFYYNTKNNFVCVCVARSLILRTITKNLRLAQLGKTMHDQYGLKICHTWHYKKYFRLKIKSKMFQIYFAHSVQRFQPFTHIYTFYAATCYYSQCKLTAYFLWRELKLTADQSAAAL